MSWKRFLFSRAVRWTTCAALVVGADLSMRPASTVLLAQEKTEKTEKKKTADELRKELEEKLKGIDLNDPKFDELTKEYEKLIKEAIGRIPQGQGGFGGQQGIIILGPDGIRDRIGEMPRFKPFNPLIPEFGNRPAGGRFGIKIEAVHDTVREQLEIPANSGQVVREVVPGSVAEKVGVKVNDIVLEFDGKPVPGDTQEFVERVLSFKADVETTMVVLRKGKRETIKGIKLPEVKADARVAPLVPVVPLIDQPGVIVAEVDRIVKALENDDDVVTAFTMSVNENGLRTTIQGTTEGRQKKVTSIRIEDGDEKIEAKSIEELPEKYRERVKQLLEGKK